VCTWICGSTNLPAAVGVVERRGGQTLEEHTHGPWSIRVMADPEGVEFCLVGGPPAGQEQS
jgi:predicted enzyme related to lactoylglutathione lyase